ncbi:MAG: tetratricopeptide repeat protein, partial [Acidobacteriota bacterium]
AALHEPYVPPPEQRARIDEVRKQLVEARVEMLAGKYLPSLVAAQKCITTAREVGYEPFVAEAHWIRGSALLATGNTDEAAQEYGEAVYTAIRSDHGDEAANAAHSAAILAVSRGKPGEAKIWLGLAQAAAKRGGVDRDFERTRLELDGLIAMEAGDLNAGVAAQEKALAMAEAELGKDSPMLYENESTLGTTLAKAGAYGKAAPHIERALALREASVGKEHPDIASLLTNLGACYTHTRELAKAKPALERALAIRERQYGKASPFLIATLDDYAELLRVSGDTAAAVATQERAVAIAKVVPGVENPMYQQIATDYADTLVAANRLADARALLIEVQAIEEKQQSAMLPTTLTSRAEVALADHAWADAQTFADRAIAGFEAAGGKDNPVLWRPLVARARVELAQNHPQAARPLLERALAIGEKGAVTEQDLAPARELLAQLH